jgi:hypothetical protein
MRSAGEFRQLHALLEACGVTDSDAAAAGAVRVRVPFPDLRAPAFSFLAADRDEDKR